MRAPDAATPTQIIFATAGAAACALAFGLGLATLSKPAAYKARLAALETQTAQAKALYRPMRNAGPPAQGVICQRAADDQARRWREGVSRSAAQNSLTVESLDVALEPQPDLSERLTPIRLRLAATGSYENTVAFLALLSREQPQVFVDSLSLRPKTSSVSLSLSGRVFCAA